MGVKYL